MGGTAEPQGAPSQGNILEMLMQMLMQQQPQGMPPQGMGAMPMPAAGGMGPQPGVMPPQLGY
jgi:hypothetical protein